MKTFFAAVTLAFCAQAEVVPYADFNGNNGYLTFDGNSQNSEIVGDDPFSYATIYTEDALESIPFNCLFETLGFRLDVSETIGDRPTNGSLSYDNYDMAFATTTRAPSSGFSRDIKSIVRKDFTYIHQGGLTIPKGFFPQDGGTFTPNSFNSFSTSIINTWGYSGGNVLFYLSHDEINETADEIDIELDADINSQLYRSRFRSEYNSFTLQDNDRQTMIMDITVTAAPAWDCDGSQGIECFLTDNNARCTNGENPDATLTFSDVNVEQDGVLSFGEAYNACVDAIGTPRFVRCGGSTECFTFFGGAIRGDPHFVGFDGARFDFKGENKKVYNLISDPHFQFNALFSEMEIKGTIGTWLNTLGFIVDRTTIVYTPQGALIDGENMIVSAKDQLISSDVSISVEENKGMILRFDSYEVSVRVMNSEEENRYYLDIETKVLHTPSEVHGVLGQTITSALSGNKLSGHNAIIEGVDSQYEVKDGITGTDFHFNRFSESFQKQRSSELGDAINLSATSIGFEE